MHKYHWLISVLGLLISGCTAENKTKPFLSSLDGEALPYVYRYDGNRLEESYPFQKDIVRIDEVTVWASDIDQQASGNEGVSELTYRFQLKKGHMSNAGVGIEFKFENWDTSNQVFVPAAVYNGNRFRSLNIPYPPYIYDKKEKEPDMPVTITQVPRLSVQPEPSRIEMLTSNCTTPMLSFYSPSRQKGFILLTTQDTWLGNSGFTIREDPEEHTASFIVAAPGVREKKYVMTNLIDSEDHAIDWNEGDSVSVRLKVYNFDASSLDVFFDRLFEVRKALSGKNEYIDRMPFSETASVILDHHDRTKWLDDGRYKYICNKPDSDSPYGHIQTGWSGIPVYAFPQAIRPTPQRVARIVSSLNMLRLAQGKSGLFYGMFKKGELFGDNFNEMNERRSIAMIRRTGLVLYQSLQIEDLLEKQGFGSQIDPEWDNMLRKAADGLVTLWNRYGQFGQFVDVETGEMDINNSTAGAINIAALALASRKYGDPRYQEVAEAAGNLYYERDLMQGYTGGGPAEILQCPDSESAAELAESLTVLYEITGKKEWLDKARFAAAMFSSWVVSYDYKFPAGSDLGRIGAKATGSVWASVQNEHSAPGIYILSGDFLLKLYRATGDERYAELLKDIAHNVVQYVTTPSNPLGHGSAPGSVSERVNLSDWEGVGGIGNVSAGDSNMAWETVALLSILQNPGIYLQTDTDKLLVLDHVNARVLERTDKGTLLEIENPTDFPAQIAVFAETKVESGKPLGCNACLEWPKVDVGSKEKIKVLIDKNGNILVR